jgi:hypothetical protein
MLAAATDKTYNTYNPSIGAAEIDDEMVKASVDYIKSISNEAFLELLKKHSKVGAIITKGKVTIPSAIRLETSQENPRYFTDFRYRLSQLDDSPLGEMLKSLSKRIAELNFPCNNVTVRFEKGCYNSIGPIWHTDYDPLHAISVCYSNIPDWSTRVLGTNYGASDVEPLSRGCNERLEEFENAGKPSKHGHLYNVVEVAHRAPKPQDLAGRTLSADDYRLFIRFDNNSDY